MSKKYSKNAKLNTVLQEIEESLLSIHDTEEESLEEIRRYVTTSPFTKEAPDHYIAQHGNVLVYYDDVYSLYRNAGYTSTDRMSLDAIWYTYRRQVGYVARALLKEHGLI